MPGYNSTTVIFMDAVFFLSSLSIIACRGAIGGIVVGVVILVLVLLVVVIIVTGVIQKRTIKQKGRYDLNPLFGTMPHEVNIEEVWITFHNYNNFVGSMHGYIIRRLYRLCNRDWKRNINCLATPYCTCPH